MSESTHPATPEAKPPPKALAEGLDRKVAGISIGIVVIFVVSSLAFPG